MSIFKDQDGQEGEGERPTDSLISNAPLDSELYKKAKEQAQQAIKRQEAEHVIKMTLKAGVPKELIGWSVNTFVGYTQKNLEKGKYEPPNKNRRAMGNLVCDLKSGWARKPLIIFVDGGTKETRVGFSQLILARAIMGNFFSLGRIGVTLPYSMLNLKFNSFDNDRQTFISNLLEIPAVYLSEVSENSGFRSTSDGAAMMDQLLETRKSPIILSLSTPIEKFQGSTTYGGVFRDSLEIAKTSVSNDKIWRFSLKTSKPCDDIMKYNAQFTEGKKA